MNYVMHYGIKGMKWGVRRYQNPDGSLTEAGKKRAARMERRRENKDLHRSIRSEKRERRRANRRRVVMSEEELAARIQRLESEKRLRQLTESEISPGRTAVKEFLRDNGKSIAGNVVKGTGAYVVKTALSGGTLSAVEAAKYISNPAKKK